MQPISPAALADEGCDELYYSMPFRDTPDEELISISQNRDNECRRALAWDERERRGHLDASGMPAERPKDAYHVMIEM